MSRKLNIVTILAVLALSISCASSEPKSDFELDIDSDEISVAISKAAAAGMIEGLIGSDLECNGAIDGQMRALLEELEREGPRARASFRDGNSVVDARRRGGKLDLDIREDDSGRIQATMPWKLAECMLGNATSVDQSMASSIKVTVSNTGGRDFSFKLQ